MRTRPIFHSHIRHSQKNPKVLGPFFFVAVWAIDYRHRSFFLAASDDGVRITIAAIEVFR
jgi:hypothetical protein